MNTENNTFSIVMLLIMAYIVSGGLLGVVSILLLGYLDWIILISTGLIHTLILFKIMKLEIHKSFLVGFLISSVSLILLYVLYLFFHLRNGGGYLVSFFCSSLFLLLTMHRKKRQFSSVPKLILLFISTVFCFLLALNLKNYYPNESKQLKTVKFKVVDDFEKPIVGDSIQISVLRKPMLNLYVIHDIEKKITDEFGDFSALLSQSTDYHIKIFNHENSWKESFEIDSEKLKAEDEILLKIRR